MGICVVLFGQVSWCDSSADNSFDPACDLISPPVLESCERHVGPNGEEPSVYDKDYAYDHVFERI